MVKEKGRKDISKGQVQNSKKFALAPYMFVFGF